MGESLDNQNSEQKQMQPRPQRLRRKNSHSGKLNPMMRRKLAGLFVAVVLALVLLLIRITYISTVSGAEYTKQVLARSQSQYASDTLAYKRGDILDRNNTVLATSEKRYHVILDCKAVNEKNEYFEPSIKAITEIFDISDAKIRDILTDKKTRDARYRILKKNVSIEEKKRYEEYVNGSDEKPLTDDQKKQRRLIHGIWFEEHYVRQYPLNTLAADLIGFTEGVDTANWGIEGYYNNSLKGVNGRSYGYWNDDADLERTIVEPKNGNSVISTIDINVQSIVEKYIQKYDEIYKNGSGNSSRSAANLGVVVMNPNDGSVLAMADSKTFDLNNPRDLSSYYSEDQIGAMTAEQKSDALNDMWKNFCISDTYEPGSVFKPVTIAAALESGLLNGDEVYRCDGSWEVAGTTIKCAHKHGDLDLAGVISESCNVGLMKIASELEVERFDQYQKLFGFGERTGIDLSGEASGIVRNSDTMSKVDLATASFGQGFNVTMIQEAAAISSIVNGGSYYRPRTVSRIIDENGAVVRSFDKILAKQTISSEVADMVKSYMKKCVEEGTSVYAKVDGYSMGGKTGTAQKIPRGNGKYLVSWIGFAPYDNPEVVIYVVIDEPNVKYQDDNRYPQWVARDILQEVLPYLGIFPDEESDTANPYLQLDLDRPEGEAEMESAADANVPEPKGTEDASNTQGGNTAETDGYTNEEAGLE